jgi:NAD dependent epimerase/dehydratase family
VVAARLAQGGREKAPAAFCRKALASEVDFEMWGDGEQTRSFMFIDDCVEGCLRIMSGSCSQPLNLGTEEMISMNDVNMHDHETATMRMLWSILTVLRRRDELDMCVRKSCAPSSVATFVVIDVHLRNHAVLLLTLPPARYTTLTYQYTLDVQFGCIDVMWYSLASWPWSLLERTCPSVTSLGLR